MHRLRLNGKRSARACILALMFALPAAVLAGSFEVAPLVLPDAGDGAQADLVAMPDGGMLLSWVEKSATGHALRMSRSAAPGVAEAGDDSAASGGPAWQAPLTIASGSNWFVNWADTPHVAALGDGTLWAHWLRKSGAGVYDYGIALVHSNDQGRTWSAPIRVEPAAAKNDYGFVAMWEQASGALGLAWLDSRQKTTASRTAGTDHDGHAGGAMMLRAASFAADGRRGEEWPLDTATCDCCTTSVAISSRGPVLAYRGRTKEEIRDTRLVRFDGQRWTRPITVHKDNWHFGGCPVNGPAVTARGSDVWVAWYTEADGMPSLRLARSLDAGDTFDAPRRIAEGRAVLGRAALAMDEKNVWLAWLQEKNAGANGQELWLGRIDAETGEYRVKEKVADLAARGRASGLPRMQLHGDGVWLVWTDVVDGRTKLRGANVRQPMVGEVSRGTRAR